MNNQQNPETHLADVGAAWWKQGKAGDYLSFKLSAPLAEGDYVLAINNQYKERPEQPDMLLRKRMDGPAAPRQPQQQQRQGGYQQQQRRPQGNHQGGQPGGRQQYPPRQQQQPRRHSDPYPDDSPSADVPF